MRCPVHAGDIIGQLKQQASDAIAAVVSPLVILQQVEEAVQAASCFRAHLDPQTCLGNCCLHLKVLSACMYVEEIALKITARQQAADVHSFSLACMVCIHAQLLDRSMQAESLQNQG